MPSRVDHEHRRTQIVDAVVQIVADEGLAGVSMRTVADRAGVSLRLVQYYFGTKDQLMRRTMTHLEEQSRRRWRARLGNDERSATPQELLEKYAEEALPTDAPSRQFQLVYRAFTVAALVDPKLSRAPLSDGTRRLHNEIADIIAASTGEPAAAAAIEAHRLMALEHGVTSALLAGVYDIATARQILAHHIAQIVGKAADQ